MKFLTVNKKYLLVTILLFILIFISTITTPQIEPSDNSIFVYGTLKYPLVRNLVCLCRSVEVPATLTDYQRDGLNIEPSPGNQVVGEIIYVSDEEMARIDKYENVPTKYTREEITIDGVRHFVYILND